MALIKCSECSADISSEEIACPRCGNPNIAQKNEAPHEEPKPALSGAAFLVFFVPLVGFILWLALTYRPPISLEAQYGIAPAAQPQTQPGTQVPLQEVKNLGYDFYLGQIEEPGVNDINDDVKNQITKVVYETHFPEGAV